MAGENRVFFANFVRARKIALSVASIKGALPNGTDDMMAFKLPTDLV